MTTSPAEGASRGQSGDTPSQRVSSPTSFAAPIRSTTGIKSLAELIVGGALEHKAEVGSARIAIVLCGPSALGKTSIAPLIEHDLARVGYSSAVVCCEGYKRYTREERIRRGIHIYDPKANRLGDLNCDVKRFLEYGVVTVPVYDHRSGKRSGSVTAKGDVLIVESIWPLTDVQTVFTVGFDAPMPLKRQRYKHGATILRGIDPAVAETQWEGAEGWLADTLYRRADEFDMRATLTEELRYQVEFHAANRRFALSMGARL